MTTQTSGRRAAHGTYHVGAYRFTGEYGLSRAIAWAKQCAHAEPGSEFVLVNEFGTVLLRATEPKGGVR